VAEAVRRIEASDGRLPIGDLAERLEIGERQLQRRFRRAVGLTPKQFSRIRRFRACARNLIAERPEAWGRVAVAYGYSDQGAPEPGVRPPVGPFPHPARALHRVHRARECGGVGWATACRWLD
jgi:transcriptional regulator GlxA family with amidase domain